ncbi:hypothetical protein WME94_51985 [Sorangium sp. So ce429]
MAQKIAIPSHIPSAPAHDGIRGHAEMMRIHRVVGQHVTVVWATKDRKHAACTGSLRPITNADMLEVWKAGAPLSLP